ncbi:hypothetical protein EA82_03026 [Enterococcus hirae]|uniref:hypothetical protein n=1 Tax=Enterococcus TaxID=1350 RepID=UPI0002A33DAF|nr:MULTISPECIES: hypothetical protein [Enterococcus]ELA56337.1 hypothetical protein OGE_05237 [Enterococcus faecium EnGen0022]PCD98551.1 hypothetical protein CKY11_14405 [Enterococcus hirae]PCE02865.1 hypothetical protein CKY13_15660 [Enterococcus hirae]RBT65952.1 hypothetical protein EA82_03026 [Enterococcus hirae]
MENKQIKLEYRRHLLDLLNDYPYPEWYERQDIRKKVERIGTLLSKIEPLMTKVTRFLGIEHTCKRISLLTAVSLIYQAIPVVPTVFDDWI